MIGNIFAGVVQKFKEMTQKPTHTNAEGVSGTGLFGGYFDEEYIDDLKGNQAAITYDKMRRGDYQISLLEKAIKNPIKGAKWDISKPNVANGDKHQAFAKNMLFKWHYKSFSDLIAEILTMVDYGYSLFELVFDVLEGIEFEGIQGNPWGFRLEYRSQKTIYEWKIQGGELVEVHQNATGDEEKDVWLKGENLKVFVNGKEGDNYEGISLYRGAYGCWWRKNVYLKLMGIGIEKHAIGIPVLTIPAGKEKSDERTEMRKGIKAYTGHQESFLEKPEGWELDIQEGKFNAKAVKEAVVLEDVNISKSILVQFIELGQHGKGGSYGLGRGMEDFFLDSLTYLVGIVTDILNDILKQLIIYNFGEQDEYPQVSVFGVNDKAGKELAESLTRMKQAKLLTYDRPLEDYIRRVFNLPEVDEKTRKEEDEGGDDDKDKKKGEMPEDVASQVYGFADTMYQEMAKKKSRINFKELDKQFDDAEDEFDTMARNRMNMIMEKFMADIRKAIRAGKNIADIAEIQTGYLRQYKEDLEKFMFKIEKIGEKQVAKEHIAGLDEEEVDPKGMLTDIEPQEGDEIGDGNNS